MNQSKQKQSKEPADQAYEPESIVSRSVSNVKAKLAARKRSQAAKQGAQTRQAQKEAKLQAKADRQAALEQAQIEVEEAIEQNARRRKSRPLSVAFLFFIAIALAGTATWYYKEAEIADLNDQISSLNAEAVVYQDLKQLAEQEEQAIAANYQTVEEDGFSIKLPRDWSESVSEQPLSQKVYASPDGIELAINFDSPLGNNDLLVPSLDYVWFIESSPTGQIQIVSQSRHCSRFDSAQGSSVSSHNSLDVICSDDNGKLTIYALGSADNFGVGPQEVYFKLTITDITNADFTELAEIIESYTASQIVLD